MRLVDLLLGRVGMSWAEALALVQAIAALDLPEDFGADIAGAVTDILLEPDGRLRVQPDTAPQVSAAGLATVLRHTLPQPGSTQGQPLPGALRYTVSRALNEVEAPPIVTVRQLSETLARFEREDRTAALSRLHARWSSSSGTTAARGDRPPEAGRGQRAQPEGEPGQPLVARPGKSEDSTEPAGDLPLYLAVPLSPTRPSLARPSVLGLSEPRTGRRVSGPEPEPAHHRSWGRRLLQAAAALLVIAAGGLVGYLAYSEWPRLEATAQTLASVTRSQWEQLRSRNSADPRTEKASQGGEGERGEGPQGPAGTAGEDRAPATESTEAAPARGSASSPIDKPAPDTTRPLESEPSTTLSSPPPSETAGADAAAADAGDETVGREDDDVNSEGRVVQALDAGRRPIFSPSFAFDGSAVFFHQDTSEGSGLREAQEDPRGERLHVVSLLDDGSRNYHPRLSPDGKLVAFDSDRDGVRGVYVSARDGTSVRRVSGPGYAAVPSWSPDGSRLAFIRAEASSAGVWNIWLLDLASGEMSRLTSHTFGQPWGASWFPDGRRVCYSHEDRLIVLDTVTRSERMYPSPRKGRLVRTPAVSPDGRRVVFQLYRDGAWLLDLDDGSMRRILADPTAEEFSWAPDGKRVAFHSRRDGQWGVWVMGQ